MEAIEVLIKRLSIEDEDVIRYIKNMKRYLLNLC